MRSRVIPPVRIGDTFRAFAWWPTVIDLPDNHIQIIWLEWYTKRVTGFSSYDGKIEYEFIP